MSRRIADQPTTRELLEIVGQMRCPCGHKDDRHRKPSGELPGEVFGACRDCDCRGLLDLTGEDRDPCDQCGEYPGITREWGPLLCEGCAASTALGDGGVQEQKGDGQDAE